MLRRNEPVIKQWSQSRDLRPEGSLWWERFAVTHPSLVCLSVTLVRPTQPVEISDNVSTPLGILAIR